MKHLSTRHIRGSGFTIIELLVVIVVIGILAAIAIPNYQQFQTRARDGRVRSNMQVLSQGMADFAERNNGAYPLNAASTCLEGARTLQQILGGSWPENPYSKTALPVTWNGWPYVLVPPATANQGFCFIWTNPIPPAFTRDYVISGYGKGGKELLPIIRNP